MLPIGLIFYLEFYQYYRIALFTLFKLPFNKANVSIYFNDEKKKICTTDSTNHDESANENHNMILQILSLKHLFPLMKIYIYIFHEFLFFNIQIDIKDPFLQLVSGTHSSIIYSPLLHLLLLYRKEHTINQLFVFTH